jgi:arginine N-succinyltransferase
VAWLQGAPTKDIEPIRRYRRARLSAEPLPDNAERIPGEIEDRLVALERTQGRNRFRAVRALCGFRDAEVRLTEKARETLGAQKGDRLHTIPFE